MFSTLTKIVRPAIRLGMEAAPTIQTISQNEVVRRFAREAMRSGRFLTITTLQQGVKKGTVVLLCAASAALGWNLRRALDE